MISDHGVPGDTVARLRAFYDDGGTRALAWRRQQLAALARMLTEESVVLEQALRDDLGKSATESRLTEIRMAVAEANYLNRHLRAMLRPRRHRLPLRLWPARGWTVREPLGVVLVVSPWNYPVQLALVPLAGAIASGNTVVLKPSEQAPATSAALANLLPRYLDPAAVAVVEGGPDEAAELLEQRFDYIFFTGSARVARIVAEAAARHLTPLTLELGGKSPVWVDGTVDLQTAADRIAWGKFLNAGQSCVAPDYVLTTDADADALVPALRRSIRQFYGDDPASSPDYARMLSAQNLDRLTAMLEVASVVIGGESDRARRYLAPTVLDHVSTDDPIMREEIFGPILPILRVPDVEAAIEIIRSGEKPLAAYVFTTNRMVRRAFAQRVSCGALGVNVPVAHLSAPELPFGGVGGSGIGQYHGEHSIRTFSHERAVLSKPMTPDTLRMVYPPHGRLADAVARWLMR
ncbi:aldehyde dehydrogenase family protein [Phytoactinopolyspora mesophila]|uniref:Aldehyde dehydrogenase n=1 Tax=Phytoactinopolyspora mesophila TaxID=2650750 RepID=A0A7K3LYR9_9ACTN|nr:aldehyde dehydrogenase family protein [Phytoactinopolyspora mesophila]NDL56164.1 aldehyde dehydrogenase family protein [Phytoactinopolyspora mesophila]